MPEEAAAPQNEDTPQVETAVSQEDTAEDTGVVDYRKRYDNLLPEYTRKSQRLAELEAQLEQQAPEEDDDEFEYVDFDPNELRRLARKEAESLLAERDRVQREAKAEEDYVNAEIERLEKELKEDFTDGEWDYLGQTAAALRDEHGRPDVQRAYEHFNGLLEGRKKKWVSGKRSARPGSGPGAAEVVDLDDPKERARFIDNIMGQHVPD